MLWIFLSNGTVHEEDVDPTSVAAAEDTFVSEPEQIEADTEAAESSEEPIFEKPEAKPVEEPEPEQIGQFVVIFPCFELQCGININSPLR